MKPSSNRLARYIDTALSQALTGLTGKQFQVEFREKAPVTAPLNEAIIWQQCFSVIDEPALWIAAGNDSWESLGRLTLETAGVDSPTVDDCRSTWQEIISQTAAGVASGITGDLLREVTPSRGEELSSDPPGLTWFGISVFDGEGASWSFKVSWSGALAELCQPSHDDKGHVPKDTSASKTFDLLLEVALPVSVSFGRTSLQIREVLKLNSGSIVELDRFVADPVEVIVNDCVIARGEVVVVDGNYGVRINQLASREERLRSGMPEAMGRIGARP